MIAGIRLTSVAGGVGAEPRESGLGGRRVSPGPELANTRDLLPLELGVDAEDRGLLAVRNELVDADDDPLAGLDLALVAERRLGDLGLEEVLPDRRDHPAELSIRSKYA